MAYKCPRCGRSNTYGGQPYPCSWCGFDGRITPTSPDGLRRYDELSPAAAAARAWAEPGPNPSWHERAREEVREAMPLLARALDRLTEQPTEGYGPDTVRDHDARP